MKRTAQEADHTRSRILDCAVDVFARQGYHAANLSDIAKRSGVTRGAVYHHFGDKAGLLHAVVNVHVRRFDESVFRAMAKEPSFEATVRNMLVDPLVELEQDPAYCSFFELVQFRIGSVQPLAELRQARRGTVDAHLERIAGLFHLALRDGAVRAEPPPEALSRTFLSLQQGLLAAWLEFGKSYSLEAAARYAADVFVAGIGATKGTSR